MDSAGAREQFEALLRGVRERGDEVVIERAGQPVAVVIPAGTFSRWTVPTIASNATATLAVRALDAIQARMPFAVRAIQIDGGSEFMAEFEQACKERGIRLFLLPPRSPRLNGCVERFNRTAREEFYDYCTADFTVAAMGRALRAWGLLYNTVRPHQALGPTAPPPSSSPTGAPHTPRGYCHARHEPAQVP